MEACMCGGWLIVCVCGGGGGRVIGVFGRVWVVIVCVCCDMRLVIGSMTCTLWLLDYSIGCYVVNCVVYIHSVKLIGQ